METVLAALRDYTKNFYAGVNFSSGNVVASPLGSWLLVASVASGFDYTANPILKEKIEKCLGLPVESLEKSVRTITEEYPALNYVAKGWTAPDLAGVPAAQQWVEDNIILPLEQHIPSQSEVDAWAADNTNNLIKQFPFSPDDNTLLILANIIYSKLTWRTRFSVVPAEGVMSGWNVSNVLRADGTAEVSFYQKNEDVFAAYEVRANSKHREKVVLVSCLTSDVSPEALLEIASDLKAMERIDEKTAESLSPDSALRVLETLQGTVPTVLKVNVPAWEAESRHNLMGRRNSLGFEPLGEAFQRGSSQPLGIEAMQVAVAKFDKEGFEAAALTAMMVGRAAVMQLTTKVVYELNFDKGFAFVSYAADLPVFSGYINTAKEA